MENRLVDTVGEGEGGVSWESSIDINKLPCVKELASKKLSYNTGSPARCPVTT